MSLTTPRSEQGQTVESAYGWCGGMYYRRVIDRSDSSEEWYRCHPRDLARMQDSEYDAGGEDYAPRCRWVRCDPPREEVGK